MSWIGIVVVIVGLLFSVAIHELGHMIPAKRFGVPVTVYSVGFGPALWRKKWRGTVYQIAAIPLGGYVKITGMFAPAKDGTSVTNSRGKTTLAQEARLASAEEIPEGLEDRAFYHLSAPRKIIVMFGGPFTNFVLSFLLFAVAFIGIGVPTPISTLSEVPSTVATPTGEVPGPAYEAGIRPGDRVVSWGGVPTETWDQVREAIGASQGPAEVVVDRAGTQQTFTVTPVEGEDGRTLAGVMAGMEYQSLGLKETAQATWMTFTGTAAIVVRLPIVVWDVAVSLFTDTPRDPNGALSVVGVGRIAGEITSGDTSIGPLQGWRPTAAALLSLLASLNMALFVFNLIPLPPLDGGHIAGAIYEGVRRQVARMRNKADPGPADTARLMPLTYAMVAVLLAMTVVLVAADIVKPVTLG